MFRRTNPEKELAREQYKSLRKAAEQAARNQSDENVTHHQLNEAIIELEKSIPIWRR